MVPVPGAASHLTVAKDVPVAKTVGKKPSARKPVRRKAVAKKAAGKKLVVKKAGSGQNHPPAVKP
jgi:hypothetical protein